MDLIVEIRFGAHLYGTETAQSDLDLKAVSLPEACDILLQRVHPSLTRGRARGLAKKTPRPFDTNGLLTSISVSCQIR